MQNVDNGTAKINADVGKDCTVSKSGNQTNSLASNISKVSPMEEYCMPKTKFIPKKQEAIENCNHHTPKLGAHPILPSVNYTNKIELIEYDLDDEKNKKHEDETDNSNDNDEQIEFSISSVSDSNKKLKMQPLDMDSYINLNNIDDEDDIITKNKLQHVLNKTAQNRQDAKFFEDINDELTKYAIEALAKQYHYDSSEIKRLKNDAVWKTVGLGVGLGIGITLTIAGGPAGSALSVVLISASGVAKVADTAYTSHKMNQRMNQTKQNMINLENLSDSNFEIICSPTKDEFNRNFCFDNNSKISSKNDELANDNNSLAREYKKAKALHVDKKAAKAVELQKFEELDKLSQKVGAGVSDRNDTLNDRFDNSLSKNMNLFKQKHNRGIAVNFSEVAYKGGKQLLFDSGASPEVAVVSIGVTALKGAVAIKNKNEQKKIRNELAAVNLKKNKVISDDKYANIPYLRTQLTQTSIGKNYNHLKRNKTQLAVLVKQNVDFDTLENIFNTRKERIHQFCIENKIFSVDKHMFSKWTGNDFDNPSISKEESEKIWRYFHNELPEKKDKKDEKPFDNAPIQNGQFTSNFWNKHFGKKNTKTKVKDLLLKNDNNTRVDKIKRDLKKYLLLEPNKAEMVIRLLKKLSDPEHDAKIEAVKAKFVEQEIKTADTIKLSATILIDHMIKNSTDINKTKLDKLKINLIKANPKEEDGRKKIANVIKKLSSDKFKDDDANLPLHTAAKTGNARMIWEIMTCASGYESQLDISNQERNNPLDIALNSDNEISIDTLIKLDIGINGRHQQTNISKRILLEINGKIAKGRFEKVDRLLNKIEGEYLGWETETLMLRAKFHEKRGNRQQALHFCDRLIRLKKADHSIYAIKASVFAKLNYNEEAIRYYNQSISLAKKSLSTKNKRDIREYYTDLGNIYKKSNKLSQALKYYNAAYEILTVPTIRNAKNLVEACIDCENQNLVYANSVINSLKMKVNESSVLPFLQGRLAAAERKHETAIEFYSKAVQMVYLNDGISGEYRFHRGLAYRALAFNTRYYDPQEAKVLLNKAIDDFAAANRSDRVHSQDAYDKMVECQGLLFDIKRLETINTEGGNIKSAKISSKR
ncbi:MAG: tetratricopeptide repeat protein [Desulfobacteraceae bacterium]|nr:tetratricopeptide repeat protein [Desulfobacteraceae bacterium]